MSLLCSRPWCSAETRLHLGDYTRTEHSATVERIPVGDRLLAVRIVAHDDETPSVLIESESCFQAEPSEVVALCAAASYALETALHHANHRITHADTLRAATKLSLVPRRDLAHETPSRR